MQRCTEESQKSKVAVISKAISNVCLYANLDIRCRLDYEVDIAHLILHQYPQAHLYSELHISAPSIRNSQVGTGGAVWHPGARHGRLFRNNSVRPSPLFRRIPKAKRAKCNLTPSWLFVSVSYLSPSHGVGCCCNLAPAPLRRDSPSTTIPPRTNAF